MSGIRDEVVDRKTAAENYVIENSDPPNSVDTMWLIAIGAILLVRTLIAQ